MTTLLACFGELPDPRLERCWRHNLIDIVFITIGAVICGADGFTNMEEFGRRTGRWLSRSSATDRPS